MLERLGRFLSLDDLWSVVGYAFLVVLNYSRMGLAVASLIAAAMLAIFWLASEKVRQRNAERYPDARVFFWALVAVVSGLTLLKL